MGLAMPWRPSLAGPSRAPAGWAVAVPGSRDLAACLGEGVLPTREEPHCSCDGCPVSRAACVASRPPLGSPFPGSLCLVAQSVANMDGMAGGMQG